MRSIFDEGKAGMVLIGMPGIEKRIARFPQLYSIIGFVHEFRALDSVEMQKFLKQRWTPVGVNFRMSSSRQRPSQSRFESLAAAFAS